MKTFFCCFLLGLTLPLSAQEFKPVIDQLTPAEVKATWEKLNNLIVKSGSIDPVELERARLQGVLQKLGKNARITPVKSAGNIAVGVDLKQEMLPRSVFYLRLGDLEADNVSQLSDALRKESKAKAVILDLRASRGASNYEQAARLISLFTGGGKTLFSSVSGDSAAGKSYAGQGDALFNGIILVLVNEDSNGAAEVAAAVLRQQVHALIVGKKTGGEALEYTSLLVNDRVNLEIAIGRLILPGLGADFLQNGVEPDVTVTNNLEEERDLLVRSEKEGVAAFIFEIERPHMNEASLVAGRNPELDNYQDRASTKEKPEPVALIDHTLQRALDAATTLLVLRESSKLGG